MIVRIYWGRIVPGSLPAIEQVYRQYNAASAPGMRARFVSQDLNDPESIYVVTVWDDVESIDNWVGSEDYKVRIANALKPFIVGARSLSLSEVRVEDIVGLLPAKTG